MFPLVAVRFLSLLLGAYVCYELCYVGVVLAGVLARCLTPTSSSWRCVSIYLLQRLASLRMHTYVGAYAFVVARSPAALPD